MIAPGLEAEFMAFTAVPRSAPELVLWGLMKAAEAEREACAQLCDASAEVNRAEAEQRGRALGKRRASRDEKCAALWATFHAAEELAAEIRSRR